MPDIHVNLVVDDRDAKHQNLNGTVVFHATKDCTVYFTDSHIFNTDHIDVKQGQPYPVAAVKSGSTTWNALTPSKSGKEGAGSPNEIVVP
jgi:hypothetical protein